MKKITDEHGHEMKVDTWSNIKVFALYGSLLIGCALVWGFLLLIVAKCCGWID